MSLLRALISAPTSRRSITCSWLDSGVSDRNVEAMRRTRGIGDATISAFGVGVVDGSCDMPHQPGETQDLV
jgi:hypothetical protein